MLLEIHVQAVRKKMSQMLVFGFQAVTRSEIKVAKVMMSHCQEKLLARTILPVPQTDTGSRVENTQVSEIKVAKVMMSHCQEKLLARTILPVPQTDTGSRVENTQVSERTLVKELGKMTP